MLKALHDKISDANVVRIYLTTLGLGATIGIAVMGIALALALTAATAPWL